KLKLRIKELEHETNELKRKSTLHQANTRSVLRASDTADLVDCISNSHILFTAKKGPMYNFPIIYQISVLSWMFVVRNDSYLNDLWLKIIKLRNHYEYYYSSKNAMVDASKTLETDYTNYDKMQQNGAVSKETPQDISVVHTSKLKKFLEGTLSLNDKSGISRNSSLTALSKSNDSGLENGKCPVIHDYNSNDQCPVTGALSSKYGDDDEEDDEIEDPKVCPLMIGDARALFKEKLSSMSISAIRDLPKSSPRVTSISAEVTENENLVSERAETSIGQKRGMSCPITGSNADTNTSNDSKRTKRATNKKIKTISPSAIKNLNYNNTKQVISVIEKHLPNRKVVWMLIDRFFDKLYIHLPFIEEESFKIRIASIIDVSDSTSQKIKLNSIGSQYCEEFLNVCLLLIILRLSWLSLPNKIIPTLTPNEHILMKPENTITMVLVDMVKEIFSSAKIMSKPSIIIFQVGLYLKFYNIMSPEDGFDLDDSYTNTNTSLLNSNDLSGDLTNESPNMNTPNFMYMLVQLAKTIGLNRDPLNFKNFYSNSDDPISIARMFRKRHLWRKLWYGLLFLTIESNLSLGDYKKGLPIEIDVDPTLGQVNKTWDCRLPGGVEQGILEKSFRNGPDGGPLKKEQLVVANFRESIIVYHLLYKSISALFSVGNPPTSKDLELIMGKLHELISERSKIGHNTSFFLKPINGADDGKFDTHIKIYRFRMFLIIKSMLFALNYLLFLNHEQKFNRLISEKTSTLTKLEKQKEYINTYFEASLLLAIDNYNVFVQVFDNSTTLFPNSGAELILYPFLMILNHRSHEFLISLILRLQQNSPVVMEILNKNNIDSEELLNRLFHYLKTFLDKLEDLTKSYYYAWRLKKLVKFFYNILTNSSKLFNINFKAMNLPSPMNSQPLNLHQQQLPQSQLSQFPSGIKREPTNAFEIAFGTSKLPPVTDYTSTLYNNDLLYSQQQDEQQVDITIGGQLADIFDDNFFSDISDFNNGDLNGISLQSQYNQQQQNMHPNHHQIAQNNINGFMGVNYNTLNEIDFTNVDLGSSFDNNGSSSGFNSGNSGLGGLNLGF
ncbi:hypothetical protein CANARDRAFT_184070, partial [[Candida] arabinofermentans NRRL YB-2248]